MAQFTGRAGIAWDTLLFYFKGGTARVKEVYQAGIGGAVLTTRFHNRSGTALGGGIEWAFSPGWSAKLEYNRLDLGTDRINFGGGAIEDITQEAHIWKVGINYRFDWGKGPVRAKY